MRCDLYEVSKVMGSQSCGEPVLRLEERWGAKLDRLGAAVRKSIIQGQM